MPDENTKPTSTARVNAYRKRLGCGTTTVHLPAVYKRKLLKFTNLVGGQKDAIITAIIALELILKGSKTPEDDARGIRAGVLPDRLKGRKGRSCKQQPKAEPDCLAELLDDESFNRVVATVGKHMPDLAEKMVKERAAKPK